MRLPLFLSVRDRKVLVVGAGPVALMKAKTLIEHGARVTLVAPEGGSLEHARFVQRDFEATDVDDAFLVVSATNDQETQRAVFEACEKRCRFVVAVDDPKNGSAAFGSLLQRPPFTIAISSDGEAPALTRLVREVLEAALPSESYITRARELRRVWKLRATPMAERFPELLAALVRPPK